MRGHALLIALILVGCSAVAGSSCTCFCFYGPHPLYGMNFDYPESQIRFSIEASPAGLVFFGSVFIDGHYGRTVGMNEHGLFASDQMVSPLRCPAEAEGPGEIYVWRAFYESLTSCSSVEEVGHRLDGKRLVAYPQLPLHNFFADRAGNAVILEAGEAGNVVTPVDGPFGVMTNFHNGDFTGVDPQAVHGDGADRYRIAYAALASAEVDPQAFDAAAAFELLRRAATSTGSYQTRYSLVLDPETLTVYIALERDMDRVWRVSLLDQTIETHQGFSRGTILPLDAEGVTAAELHARASDDAAASRTPQALSTWLLVLLGAGLLLAAARLLSAPNTGA